MVVNLKTEVKCQRCGAKPKEAKLTVSHSPHHALLKMCSLPYKEKAKLTKKYFLCEKCRRVHYELEKRVMIDACVRMAKLHEEYLNQ